jgi:ribonuclease D
MQRQRPDHHKAGPGGPRRDGHRFSAPFNGKRRERNHEQAEAEALRQAEAAIPDHPLVCRDNPILVTTPQGLARTVSHLRDVGRFGFDTEFIGEQSYFPKLCLVQAATPERVFVIDAMARDLDLTPFWELVVDPTIEKVVHAGLQDLEPATRYTGRMPANVFDTQIAAAFAGYTYPVGLARLVTSLVSIDLGKGLKFSQWDRRPLSQVQIRYAASDVRFLLLLRQRIEEKLEAAGNLAWAREECNSLCSPSNYGFDPEIQYQRVRGAGPLRPRELAVLRQLVIWRDEQARHHDLPPRTLLPDAVLIQLSRAPVSDVEGLRQVSGMPRPLISEHGDELVKAIAQGLKAAPADMPQQMRVKETAAEKEAIASLWQTMENVAKEKQIDIAMISSKAELSETCRLLARGTLPMQSRLFSGWRSKVAGPVIRQALMTPLAAPAPEAGKSEEKSS